MYVWYSFSAVYIVYILLRICYELCLTLNIYTTQYVINMYSFKLSKINVHTILFAICMNLCIDDMLIKLSIGVIVAIYVVVLAFRWDR